MTLRIEHEVYIRKHAKRTVDNGKKRKVEIKEESENSQENYLSESASESFRSVDTENDFERKDHIVREVNLIDVACKLLSC